MLLSTGPFYGKYGGALSLVNLFDDKIIYSLSDIVFQQGIGDLCLSKKDDCVWCGTTCYGENTSPECIDDSAHIFLYNYIKNEIEQDYIPKDGNKSIGYISEIGDYVLFLYRDGSLGVINMETTECSDVEFAGKIRKMIQTTDEHIYFNTEDAVYEIDEFLNINKVVDGFANVLNLSDDIVTNDVYFYDNLILYKISFERD